MKKVYIVYGSEDGVMGVYGSLTRAIEEALHYVRVAGGGAPRVDDVSGGSLDPMRRPPVLLTQKSMRAARKYVRHLGDRVTFYAGEGTWHYATSAEVEAWEVE